MCIRDSLESEQFVESLNRLLSVLSKDISEQLRKKRSELGYSQSDLAKMLGTKQSRISQVEDPKYGKLSLTTLAKLAVCMNCDLKIELVNKTWESESAAEFSSETSFVQTVFEDFYKSAERAGSSQLDQLDFLAPHKEQYKLIETQYLKGEEKGRQKWVV